MTYRSTPWIFWPIVAVIHLLGFILGVTGRLVGIILGMVLVGVGVLISLTIVGSIIGVPIAIFGVALITRSFF